MKRLGGGLVWIVGSLLALTLFGLGAVAWGTVRASGDAAMRPGLDYHTFLSSLDDLVREAGDTTLVRFDVVSERLPDGTLGDGVRLLGQPVREHQRAHAQPLHAVPHESTHGGRDRRFGEARPGYALESEEVVRVP